MLIKKGTTFKKDNQTYIIMYWFHQGDLVIDINSVEYDKNKKDNRIGYCKVNKDGTIDKGCEYSYPKSLRKYFSV
jgi:hypothetical protein